MKKFKSSSFKLNPIAASIALAMATQLTANVAYGNAGYGINTDISGTTFAVPTYYAGSSQGLQPALDPVTHLPTIDPTTKLPWASAAAAYAGKAPMVDTGTPLRKFVDPLRGVDGAGIPLAITEKWFNPLTNTQTQDDYYEIGIVQYTQQMHSDLPKATTLRGYVQIETEAIAQGKCSNPKVTTPGLCDAAGVQSEHIAATYPDGTFIKDAQGNQVFWVHKPHYMGPIIVASRGTAVRMKYTNYLPYNDSAGNPVGATNGGELPLPVDEHLAGGGPVVDANGNPVRDQNGNPMKFAQNRAMIHWHGGDTPWISDGTPHQWVVPAGDVSYIIKDPTHPNGLGKGDSFQSVPDMPDPGPGSGTLYFPNNLSARLMFFHDHTSALTRLNVYMGEAAGYVVTDPVEQNLVKTGIIPNTLLGVGIPLVIQDKTFVPKNVGSNAPQSQDAKWDVNHWGQPGDLWFPHVYEVNQDPNSIDATNPVGRWDWGPWFWPVFPAQYSLPTGSYGDATTTPEAFMDTMVVNGQAYPTLTVDPVATRFRILSVGNDRALNLSLYQAVDANGKVCDVATNPTPAVAASAPGQTAALAACTELRMVPAATTSRLPDSWPTDGRAGGVPDPATMGPDIIQIGNEAGLLPAPVIIHPQPVTYDQNKRSVTIFNVLNHALLLGGAERADVIVDFSKYAGKTLILYNDSPAPMPGLDPRIDYFTGQGDQTDAGGSYDTLPGYGPNTRTIMQIKVNPVAAGATPAAPFNTAALAAALPAAYKVSQPAPIVPESAYNAAFGTTNTDNYARIFTGSNTQPDFMYTAPGYGILYATLTTVGAGYKSAPEVVINGKLPVGGIPAKAKAIMEVGLDAVAGRISRIEFTEVGQGYLTPPTITLVGGNPTIPATATITNYPKPVVNTAHVINKAIQELFDPVYGRMNATLAVELPFTTATIATTVPLAYIDAPIDDIDGIKDGETQIWKITHNGVDSHPVHFHLVNVQVINRVDWVGVVKPPQPNELGWKETLLMSPLEDVYVAVKAVHPVAPFGLPKSARVLDPSQSVGSQLGFTQIDQMTGQAPTFQTQLVNGVMIDVPTNMYSNQLTDFDNEYVWHCHILGHEENDFMRPFIFHPNVVVPDAPGKLTVTGNRISWSDPTPVNGFDVNGVWTMGLDAQGVPTAGLDATGNPASSPKNEIGFYVQKKGLNGKFATVATVAANVTTWKDPAQVAGDTYQVVAFNIAGQSAPGTATTPIVGSSIVASTSAGAVLAAAQQTLATTTTATAIPATTAPATTVPVPAVPSGLTQTLNANGSVTVSWNAVPGATIYLVNINGVQQVVTGTSLTLAAASNSNISVVAVGPGGTSLSSTSLYNGTAFAPVAFSAANLGGAPGSVSLIWANSPSNVNNVTGLTLSWTQLGTTTTTTKSFPAASTGVTVTGLTSGASYTFTIVANGTAGNSVVTPSTSAAVVVQ